jgi:hypothetical protein
VAHFLFSFLNYTFKLYIFDILRTSINLDRNAILNSLGCSEISNLGVFVFCQEYVEGLHISMQNTFLCMKILNPKTYLDKKFPDKIFVKKALLFIWISRYLLINVGLKISLWTIFQNYIDTQVNVNKRINVTDDIWRLKTPKKFNFFHHGNTNFLREFLSLNHLYYVQLIFDKFSRQLLVSQHGPGCDARNCSTKERATILFDIRTFYSRTAILCRIQTND